MTDALRPPKKTWWQRLNEKPPGWDEPKNRRARVIMAIFLGVSLYFSRHWLGIH